MTTRGIRRVPLHVATFIVLVALSLSNIFAWPDVLGGYRSFSGNSLVNSVLNGSFNRSMEPATALAYLMITTPANYVASLVMKIKPRWRAIVLFVIVYFAVSTIVSLATVALYLTGQ